MVDSEQVKHFIEESWNSSALETLQEYVKIPNQSPDYDPEIHTNGLQEKAMALLVKWVKSRDVQGLTMRMLHDEGRTPLLFMEVAASDSSLTNTILLYGHMDKQPPLTGQWADGLHPYQPVIRDGKLYGRGGADDGYAIFAAVDAIGALQAQGLAHPRCVIVIEASEESGSPDLVPYLEQLEQEVGEPSMVICLDSGSGNYEQLWMTTSLRGVLMGTVRAQLLEEGIHSGDSGFVRDSFHVLREVLDRLDDCKTAEMHKELHVDIPEQQRGFAQAAAKALGKSIWEDLPLHGGAQPQLPPDMQHAAELLLNRTWRPQLAVTGVGGLPDLKGGNVLRKQTTLKLSIRLPPTLATERAVEVVKRTLTANPPYNADVQVTVGVTAEGFVAPEFKPWLLAALQEASQAYFGKACQFFGEGGSIPFMGLLQKKYPRAQFVITGVLGPNSNAHGPNEFLHIAYTKGVIACVANVVYACGRHQGQ